MGRRRSIFFFVIGGLAILLFALGSLGCGNYNYNSFGANGTVTGGTGSGATGLSERVFVANLNPNAGDAGIQVVDASKDLPALNSSTLQPFTVTLGGSLPTLMVPGPNSTTVVFNSGDDGVSVVDNTTEALIKTLGTTDCTSVSCEFQLPGPATSMVESSDGKFIYAAVPTDSQVTVIPLTASTITPAVVPATPLNCANTSNCLPGARNIILSPDNSKLLVFANNLANQFEMMNTTVTPPTVQTISSAQLDHPIYGVFSSDNTKAYILSCGPECGGTQASVSVLDTTALTLSQTTNVDSATIGTSDSTNLYVAGTNPSNPSGGSATILPLSSLSGGKQVAIGNGFHQIVTVFESKVLIGASNCTTGCLSILDPSAGSAIVDSPKGNVTAITGVTPRTVFYTAEGKAVHVYDLSTGNEHFNNGTPVIQITGQVTSVLYVGPQTK